VSEAIVTWLQATALCHAMRDLPIGGKRSADQAGFTGS
jgi:hypothetical protein